MIRAHVYPDRNYTDLTVFYLWENFFSLNYSVEHLILLYSIYYRYYILLREGLLMDNHNSVGIYMDKKSQLCVIAKHDTLIKKFGCFIKGCEKWSNFLNYLPSFFGCLDAGLVVLHVSGNHLGDRLVVRGAHRHHDLKVFNYQNNEVPDI